MGIALLILLQTFMGVLTVTTLALVAVLAERRKAEEAQAELVGQPQPAPDKIKTIHGMIPICAWCKKSATTAHGSSWKIISAIQIRPEPFFGFGEGEIFSLRAVFYLVFAAFARAEIF